MTKPDSDRCLNCERTLDGPYCAQCGQRSRSLDLSLRQVMSTVVEEVFAFDDRVLRTMKPLLFKPGFVAQEYLAGRRARFVPPLRLFLFVSFILFLALALSPDTEFRFTSSDSAAVDTAVTDAAVTDTVVAETGNGSGGFGARLAEHLADPEQLNQSVLRWLNQALFVLVPVFALLLKLTHRREPYIRHFIYAVYFHAFAFLVLAVTEIPAVLRLENLARGVELLVLWIPVYFYLGLRRMYGESRMITLAKAGFILVAYLFCLMAAMLSVLFLAVLI